MPIGKNAIKRITNNGYSNVKTSAPDMENSAVAEEKITVAEEKKATPKKTAPKKATPKAVPKKKAAPKKSMESEPELSPVKTLEKVVEKPSNAQKREGDGYINIGGELPIHLL